MQPILLETSRLAFSQEKNPGPAKYFSRDVTYTVVKWGHLKELFKGKNLSEKFPSESEGIYLQKVIPSDSDGKCLQKVMP